MKTAKNKLIQPIFRNKKTEAEYWEKNIKTAWQKATPKRVAFAKNLSETINIRLNPETLHYIRGEAEKMGIGPTQLIRIWIKERMHVQSKIN